MAKPFTGAMLLLISIALSLGIFMNVLDSSIANVAIPTIAGDLAVSANQGTWVITSFAVSTAIVLPLTGWLARRFGEVRLFVISTAAFTLVSFLCGLSNSLPMLIFFRVLQGAVAGPMIPLSQSLLLANYPSEKQGLATAIWAMTAVVAPIFGPIIGGWITDNYSWPWIFYINIPVGIFSVYVTWTLLKDRETKISKSPIDVIGLILLILGIGSLQILLDKGNDLDWFHSNVIISLGITSFISLCYFIVWELTDDNPVLDLRLFAVRNFTVGTLALSFGYLVFFGNVVVLPLWLQTQMGYTATWAGIAAAPIGIISLFLSPFVGKYINKVDLRILVSFGFLVFALCSFWYSNFNTDISLQQIMLPRFLQGIGIPFFFIPLLSVLLSGLPAEKIASAAGISNFLRILGGSFGTSLTITLWNRREAVHHNQLVDQITNMNMNVGATQQLLHSLGFNVSQGFQLITQILTTQSFMLATDDIFWLTGWLFIILMVFIWFAKPPFTSAGKAAAME